MKSNSRQPAIFLSHGGGPWPFVDIPFIPPGALAPLERYLRSMITALPSKPKAALVVSAHWEEPVATLMTNPTPPMLYDYTGYEQKAYELQWPAPGATFLVDRVTSLLRHAGFRTATNSTRGFDHGTFIPLMVALPAAELPILQVSLLDTLDPTEHLALGRALAPLRDENVLLIGSGNSYHNMRGFGHPESTEPSRQFDVWLANAMMQAPAERERQLIQWERAPSARHCHPREEHLLPLHVMAGAGLADAVTFPLRMEALHVHASGIQFG
jgi:aromatic ring-opening dioxygenase catalytic subunit (LigB family)